MTRKHFRAIAQILRDAPMPDDVRRSLASEFASYLYSQNERFNRSRFLEACGVTA